MFITFEDDKSVDQEEVKPTGDGARSERQEPDQLARIENELNDAGVPQEVWIGTDSTADRVSWLIVRNKLNQQNSRRRLKTIESQAEALRGVAIMLNTELAKYESEPWAQRVRAALALVDGPQNQETK